MEKIMNGFLIGSGVALIVSCASGSLLTLTICLTLFIIAVILNFCRLFSRKNIFAKMFEATENNANESFKNKQYGKAFVNFVASPIVIIGIVTVVLCMGYMWSMALK